MREQRLWKIASLIAIAAICLFLGVIYRQTQMKVVTSALLPYGMATQTEAEILPTNEARVWLEAPTTAVVDQPFIVRLMAEGVPALGGFEVMLQFDPATMPLFDARASDNWAGNRQLLHVGSIRVEDGIILGSASCPVADCTSIAYDNEPRLGGMTAVDPIEIAVFEFTGGVSAELPTIRDMLLVDGAGRTLLAQGQFEADAINTSEPVTKDLDLSKNGVINDADAYLVVSAWQELRRNGRCLHENIHTYDVNNSGCLTMADAQAILGAWGEWMHPTSTPPASGGKVESTFVVDSDGDQDDLNPGDGQCRTLLTTCTLRAAVQEANARPGPDIIHFDIRNGGGNCPELVTLQPSESIIIDAPDNEGGTIDGYTQCNSSANSNWISGNAIIKIELAGSNEETVYGIHVLSPNNVIKGLAVYNWHRQIQLLGSRAHDNTVAGNFLGTNAANTFTQSAPGIEGDGIRLDLGANGNLVGGNTAAARNIVSGNDQDGIGLQGDGVENNILINNFVGLNQNGTERLRNGADGIDAAEGVAHNWIGGLNPGERNVISGNNRDGVELSHNPNNTDNHVVGNFIGLRSSGDQALYNGGRGVTLEDQVSDNFVYRNVIAGNAGDGVRFYTVFDNQVYDNFIGVVPTGLGPRSVIVPVPGNEDDLVALPNGALPERDAGLSGIYMTGGSRYNSVTHNIIAYHPEHGILLDANEGYLSYGTCETRRNTFSQNSLFANESKGIKLRSGGCDDGQPHYPNEGIDPPEIISATTMLVMGETCADCLVQLFQTDKAVLNDPNGDNWGEGQIYLTEGTADSDGYFAIDVTAVTEGDILTAHTTDSNGNTSEFAHNVQTAYAPPPIYRLYLSFVRQDG